MPRPIGLSAICRTIGNLATHCTAWPSTRLQQGLTSGWRFFQPPTWFRFICLAARSSGYSSFLRRSPESRRWGDSDAVLVPPTSLDSHRFCGFAEPSSAPSCKVAALPRSFPPLLSPGLSTSTVSSEMGGVPGAACPPLTSRPRFFWRSQISWNLFLSRSAAPSSSAPRSGGGALFSNLMSALLTPIMDKL